MSPGFGEPQILGQLKQQFEVASAADAVGPVLHRVFHKSFSAAKRVRSETGVAARAVSVASVAADLARQIFARAVGQYGFRPDQIFFDSTVFPLAIDMPMEPGVPGHT